MWIKQDLPMLNVKVCQGIGGTLDAITCETKRAPAFSRKLPLEWLYRLIIDPKRIRRQAIIPTYRSKVLRRSERITQ